MADIRTTITICGKEYNIVSPDSKEHVHRVAMFLDDIIKTLHDENPDINSQMLMTLAALNISDDLLKTKDRLESISSEMESLRDMAREIQIKKQVSSGSDDRTAALEEEIDRLKRQLAGNRRSAGDYR